MMREEILDYLSQLNDKMRLRDIKGELHIYGGAVMCLVLKSRTSTKDVDGWFVPKSELYELAQKVAEENNIKDDWLNDGVKGFISSNDEMEEFLRLSNLTISAATPSYVFAMKCMAARMDKDARDIDDIHFLLNYLKITNYNDAINLVLKYFPQNLITIKTQLLLEEILGEKVEEGGDNND